MTTEQHPITPTPELVREWDYEHGAIVDGSMDVDEYIVIQTSRFRRIADDELEACREWLHYNYPSVNCEALYAAMRPKPPSLAEQALAELDQIPTHDNEGRTVGGDVSIIRTALERLQELESDG